MAPYKRRRVYGSCCAAMAELHASHVGGAISLFRCHFQLSWPFMEFSKSKSVVNLIEMECLLKFYTQLDENLAKLLQQSNYMRFYGLQSPHIISIMFFLSLQTHIFSFFFSQ